MKKLVYLLLFVAPSLFFGNKCDCEANFEWAKTTFESNDAGFEYAISLKGKSAYESHTEAIAKKASTTSDIMQCEKLVREWLTFFRKGHKGFYAINTEDNTKETVQHPSVEPIDIQELKDYLSSKNNLGYEGIWVSDPYTIAVKEMDGVYRGSVLEVSGGSWKPNQVKFYINPDDSGVYYMGDYSENPFLKATLFREHLLEMNGIYFTRIFPQSEVNPSVERYLKLNNAWTPLVEHINQETYLFKIPSFDLGHKKAIDSLVSTHFDKITSTKNLIIDLRGNTGGAGKSFTELLPILYTNPVKTIYWEHWSTPLNNERWKNWLKNPDLSEEGKRFLTNVSKKLDNNLGEFVYIYENDGIEVYEQETIHKYPENIAILIDQYNASTAEQFLLAAKQSKKVKLYGKTTFGALDISEMNQVESPDGNFKLEYCLTKSLRIPDFPIDGIGIQPDYFLDESILPYNWIDYVLQNMKL